MNAHPGADLFFNGIYADWIQFRANLVFVVDGYLHLTDDDGGVCRVVLEDGGDVDDAGRYVEADNRGNRFLVYILSFRDCVNAD